MEGGRERKRRETHRRITDAALRLFLENGYEATTLDAVAAEAGIARRTFFHYFRSKEEIILAWQSALPDALHDAVLRQDAAMPPLEALEHGLTSLAAGIRPEVAVLVSGIVRSNEQLRMSNQAKFLNMERAAYDALCALKPDEAALHDLRIAAMIGIGAMRLSIDDWSSGGGKPLTAHLADWFARLTRVVGSVPG